MTIPNFRPNVQNLNPFSDQNGSKTISFGAAHTYIPDIGEYPPPRPGYLSYHQPVNRTGSGFLTGDWFLSIELSVLQSLNGNEIN